MKEIEIKLTNCYGIQELQTKLKFERSNAVAIYAPNGVMKTSLAKTFSQLAAGQLPTERLYDLPSTCEIKCDGKAIEKQQILVIHPFDADFEVANLSALLVDTEKKKLYDQAFKEIFDGRKRVTSRLQKTSGLKQADVDQQIAKDFGVHNILDAIRKIKEEGEPATDLADLKYAEILDSKVIELLSEKGIKEGLSEYSKRYSKLIEESPLFTKGKFNAANADAVSKSLKKEKFFEGKHKVVLNGSKDALESSDSLDAEIQKAQASILNDPGLKDIHSKILSGVASIRSFQQILGQTPELANLLSTPEELRKTLWKNYYHSDPKEFDLLLSNFDARKAELLAIEQSAKAQETEWHEAKNTFKDRFFVPFDVEVENRANAILGTHAPNLSFKFPTVDGKTPIFNRGQLDSLEVLSVGERRAMYLLFVIFEFQLRIKSAQPVVIVIDDIADSFDYKNKYAIIEYLRELSLVPNVRLILLTHNFDFFRTTQGRIVTQDAQWENSFIAQRRENSVTLLPAGSLDITDPFKFWKKGYKEDRIKLLAMIPFIRNLIEFRDGTSGTEYLTLTSLLHQKSDSNKYTVKDFVKIMSDVIKDASNGTHNEQSLIIDLILESAIDICKNRSHDETSLENKVVLSIAIRLLAERFMLLVLSDKSEPKGNQTTELFKRLQKEDTAAAFKRQLKSISRVVMMTPENIHLNSFMYEPLLDMSIAHLIRLHAEIEALKP